MGWEFKMPVGERRGRSSATSWAASGIALSDEGPAHSVLIPSLRASDPG